MANASPARALRWQKTYKPQCAKLLWTGSLVLHNIPLRRSHARAPMHYLARESTKGLLSKTEANTVGAAEHGAALAAHAKGTVHQVPETPNDVMSLSRHRAKEKAKAKAE